MTVEDKAPEQLSDVEIGNLSEICYQNDDLMILQDFYEFMHLLVHSLCKALF